MPQGQRKFIFMPLIGNCKQYPNLLILFGFIGQTDIRIQLGDTIEQESTMSEAESKTDLAKPVSKWRKWVLKQLKGTHDHYLFFLPSRNGFHRWLLHRFFRGITIDPKHLDMIKQLPPEAVVVYTTKHKSYFEFLFYHIRFRRVKVREPELTFGMRSFLLQPGCRVCRNFLAHLDWLITRHERLDPYGNGYWRRELLNGRAALLPLVEKHGFYRRFVKSQTDPLRFLIELQQTQNRPVYIVPLLMFTSKSPVHAEPRLRDLILGTEQHPGILRRFIAMIRFPGKVFVEISQPLALNTFLDESRAMEDNQEYQALMLRRQLLQQHNRHRQSITGPVIKSREELKENILATERLRDYMAQYAESRNENLPEVRKQADGYLDEIAAHYSHFFVSMVAKPVGWLLNTMFDGTVVDQDGLQRMKTLSQKSPVIVIPCHKSHIDYLILSYVLINNNMPSPHIAAGKNLSFWPFGPLARAGGAFFLRRTFKGAVLYSKVFAEYIHKLLEDGFNLEIFIEGGRSRTGKLLMPKLGFLSMLLNAFKSGACEDMIFAPVFIGYDQVLEENAFVHELEGGKKEPENFYQMIKARHFLKRRYGKIYINFPEPISLQELLETYPHGLKEMTPKDQNALCRDLGWRVINAIDRTGVVTPFSLVAAAALNCPAKRFSAEELFRIIDTYMALLNTQDVKLTDTMLMDPTRACEHALENYVQRKLIELPSGEKNMPADLAQYSLPASHRMQLEYYKNNCIAFFIPAAFTALAILEKEAFQFSAADLHDRYRYFQDFFKYEFAFNMEKSTEVLVRKSIKSFIEDAILSPHATLPDTYQITATGLRKFKLFTAFLTTYFVSYWVVLAYLKRTPRNGNPPKERLKKIQALGKTLFKHEEIELPESLSKINFANGLNFFGTHGVKGSENVDEIEAYEKTIRNFLYLIKQ